MKTLITLFTLVLICTTPIYAKDLKVGHLDLQKIISQSAIGKEARAKYQLKAASYQEEIDHLTAQVNSMRREIEAAVAALEKGEALSPAMQEKDKRAGMLFRKLQRLLGGYKEELRLYDAELTRTVLASLQPVVSRFAKEKKYDYLYQLHDKIIFASPKMDISDTLIKRLDKATKKKK